MIEVREHHQFEDMSCTIVRSKQRKRTIAIYVSQKGIEVKVPFRTSSKQIHDMLTARSAWIKKKLAGVPLKKLPWYQRRQFFYRGIPYPLKLEIFPFVKKRAECVLQDNHLRLTLAQRLAHNETNASIIKALEAWYRTQAAQVLKERTAYFAAQMQVEPKAIIVKAQKRRWGSCDSRNIIRYNWKIIMAPSPLLDYLVVHELAHIKVKNHSPQFWDFVASVLPEHKALRKELHDFGQGIIEG